MSGYDRDEVAAAQQARAQTELEEEMMAVRGGPPVWVFPLAWAALFPVRLAVFVWEEYVLTRKDGTPRFSRL